MKGIKVPDEEIKRIIAILDKARSEGKRLTPLYNQLGLASSTVSGWRKRLAAKKPDISDVAKTIADDINNSDLSISDGLKIKFYVDANGEENKFIGKYDQILLDTIRRLPVSSKIETAIKITDLFYAEY